MGLQYLYLIPSEEFIKITQGREVAKRSYSPGHWNWMVAHTCIPDLLSLFAGRTNGIGFIAGPIELTEQTQQKTADGSICYRKMTDPNFV